MKKNLKKVISLVSAFAMAATTFVAATSAKVVTPPDVVGTQYEQAVKELVALGVVTGYEDGTYKPENNITRAEVTKLVVDSMGPRYHENAIAASGKDTQFTDVLGTHWAAGYVSTGVANSFIAGMGDGTFAPEENVTYAQVVKMIIAAMGYTSICEKQGGYPNGYISVASQQGVTVGVTNVSADQDVTRGQVALLLDNAVKLPIVAITGYEESEYTGQLIAKTEIMDDIVNNDAKNYQTLLTKNHDAYVVRGRILNTKRSDSSLDAGQVEFQVEATKNFDDTAYGSGYTSGVYKDKMYYDEDDADAMMFVYAEAIIREDDNGEFTILTLTKAGNNEITELPTSYYDTSSLSGSNPTMDMFQSADSTKTKTYKLDPAAVMYVNGVEVGSVSASNVDDYIAKNNNGTVQFVDATEEAKTTTDGKIDYLLVTYFEDAVVDSVQTNSANYKIYWKEAAQGLKTLTVDPEDDDVVVTITKNGEVVDYTALAEYDIASIAYDVTQKFEDSDFYDVRVSDKKVEGKVSASSQNSNDEYYYTIGGTNYTASYSRYGNDSAYDNGTILSVGKEYVAYLNVFDNIAYYDEDSTKQVIGIVDYANVDSSDTPKIRIITTAGTKVSYTVKDNSKTTYTNIASKFFNGTVSTNAGTAAQGKKPLAERVCEYTINSSGYITAATPLDDAKAIPANSSYKESTTKMGSLALADSTIVIDLSDNPEKEINDGNYSKVSATTVANLEDDGEYEGVVASKSNADSTYRLLVITSGGATYNANTPIYVYSKSGSEYDDEQGAAVDTLVAYGPESDETVSIKVDSTCTKVKDSEADGARGKDSDGNNTFTVKEGSASLNKGSIFVYDKDSSNFATEIKVIFDGVDADQADFFKKAVGVGYNTKFTPVEPLFTNNVFPVEEWLRTTDATKAGKVGMVFGPVIDKSGNNITIGKIQKDASYYFVDKNNGGVEDVSLVNGANVYVYDYSESRVDNRLSKATAGSIVKTSVPAEYRVTASDQDIVRLADKDGNSLGFSVNFIVAKTVDDDITDALVILMD